MPAHDPARSRQGDIALDASTGQFIDLGRFPEGAWVLPRGLAGGRYRCLACGHPVQLCGPRSTQTEFTARFRHTRQETDRCPASTDHQARVRAAVAALRMLNDFLLAAPTHHALALAEQGPALQAIENSTTAAKHQPAQNRIRGCTTAGQPNPAHGARAQHRRPARRPHPEPSTPDLTPRHRNPLVITADQCPSQLALPFDTDPQPTPAITVVPGTVIQPTTTASTRSTTSATHPGLRLRWRRLWHWTARLLFRHN
ncbi:hypothetical protein ACFU7Y_42055 [Kitasatospora sp. NPDC057542]|uniref:hypothetical protein n=1 Tax=Kitasatospora sp. NPDC057542 TaxID=3346162 RepID=UPI0036A9247A